MGTSGTSPERESGTVSTPSELKELAEALRGGRLEEFLGRFREALTFLNVIEAMLGPIDDELAAYHFLRLLGHLDGERFLSFREAARRLGLTPHALRGRIRRGSEGFAHLRDRVNRNDAGRIRASAVEMCPRREPEPREVVRMLRQSESAQAAFFLVALREVSRALQMPNPAAIDDLKGRRKWQKSRDGEVRRQIRRLNEALEIVPDEHHLGRIASLRDWREEGLRLAWGLWSVVLTDPAVSCAIADSRRAAHHLEHAIERLTDASTRESDPVAALFGLPPAESAGPRLTAEERVLVVLQRHPDWNMKQLAEKAGVSYSALRNSKRYPTFHKARALLKESRKEFPPGTKRDGFVQGESR